MSTDNVIFAQEKHAIYDEALACRREGNNLLLGYIVNPYAKVVTHEFVTNPDTITGFYISPLMLKQISDKITELDDAQKRTYYQNWSSGAVTNLGGFLTSLFKTYQIADSDNTERLNSAFPEYFVQKR